MNEAQQAWLEEVQAAINYAKSGAVNYEATVDRIQSLLDSCPEP